jgi:hypothetical protein
MRYETKNIWHKDFLLIKKFKTFYVTNDNSNLRSVFTNKLVSTRSLKIAAILIYFDKLFCGLKFINHSTYMLSKVYIRSYQPKKLTLLRIFADFFAHKLLTPYFAFFQR